MKVLVINCGSSSLKYQVIDSETEHVLAKGLCERIGIDGVLTYQPAGQDKIKYEAAMPAHRQAVELVLKQLTDPENGVLKSIDEIDAVGHRMVHGGEKFACSTLLTEEVLTTVESCNDLAPLHNPPTLWVLLLVKSFFLQLQWLVYLIQLSIRLCHQKLTSMVFHMSTMRNTLFVVTASTEHLINMFL